MNHRGIFFRFRIPVPVGIRFCVGYRQAVRVFCFRGKVRQRISRIQEERLGGGVANKLQRAFGEQIMTVLLPGLGVPRQFQAALIVVQILGKVIMRVILIQIAEPHVETLVRGPSDRAGISQGPFSHATTAVTRLLQDLRDGHITFLQIGRVMRDIVPCGTVSVVESGQQHGPRSRTDGTARIGLCEPHSLGG